MQLYHKYDQLEGVFSKAELVDMARRAGLTCRKNASISTSVGILEKFIGDLHDVQVACEQPLRCLPKGRIGEGPALRSSRTMGATPARGQQVGFGKC